MPEPLDRDLHAGRRDQDARGDLKATKNARTGRKSVSACMSARGGEE